MVHDTCAVQFTWRKDILQVLTTDVIVRLKPSDISIPQLCHSKSELWGDMSWNGLMSRYTGESHKSWPQADWSNMTLGGNRFHSPITAILDVYCQLLPDSWHGCKPICFISGKASIPRCWRLQRVPSQRPTRRPWPYLTKVPCAVELVLPCLKKGASTGKLQNALREINATAAHVMIPCLNSALSCALISQLSPSLSWYSLGPFDPGFYGSFFFIKWQWLWEWTGHDAESRSASKV